MNVHDTCGVLKYPTAETLGWILQEFRTEYMEIIPYGVHGWADDTPKRYHTRITTVYLGGSAALFLRVQGYEVLHGSCSI